MAASFPPRRVGDAQAGDLPHLVRTPRGLFIFALLFTALFILHAPLLRLPYFWDEAGYYVPAARDLLLHGSLIPRSTASAAHPPLALPSSAQDSSPRRMLPAQEWRNPAAARFVA